MEHEEALKVAHEVQEAIRELDHLYVSVIIKPDGKRQVIIRRKRGGLYEY